MSLIHVYFLNTYRFVSPMIIMTLTRPGRRIILSGIVSNGCQDFCFSSDCSRLFYTFFFIVVFILYLCFSLENGIPYWIVKNSYGDAVEENGYFRMQRSDNPYGACRMLNDRMTTATVE